MTCKEFSLEGKKVLVTGASSGIGREVCIRTRQAGAEVYATGRDRARLEETAGLMGDNRCTVIPADLSTEDGLSSVCDSIPAIDGLVNCAGIIEIVPLKFITPDKIRGINRINYEVPVLLTQRLSKHKKLNQGSSLLAISSIYAHFGEKAHALYAGSKGGLEAAFRSLAVELAAQKIRVNCIASGMVKTQMAKKAEEILSPEALQKQANEYPLGFGQPSDVANAVLFLLSDASKWITGSTLVVDGGFSCR